MKRIPIAIPGRKRPTIGTNNAGKEESIIIGWIF